MRPIEYVEGGNFPLGAFAQNPRITMGETGKMGKMTVVCAVCAVWCFFNQFQLVAVHFVPC